MKKELSMEQKYEKYTDEELILMLRDGEEKIMEYLLNKYKNLVKAMAGSYFIPGADEQDILQEGMIGLYKAIRDFNGSKETSFLTFAKLCIARNIQTAINKANRKKQDPLNKSLSLDEQDGSTENIQVSALKRLGMDNPEHILIDRENYAMLRSGIEKSLSKTEKEVFLLMLQGMTYQEIAEKIASYPKSIDNAISRIKAKAKQHLSKKTQNPIDKQNKTMVR